MKKKLKFEHEVWMLVDQHAEAVRSGTSLDMCVAEVCVNELVALGRRALAKL